MLGTRPHRSQRDGTCGRSSTCAKAASFSVMPMENIRKPRAGAYSCGVNQANAEGSALHAHAVRLWAGAGGQPCQAARAQGQPRAEDHGVRQQAAAACHGNQHVLHQARRGRARAVLLCPANAVLPGAGCCLAPVLASCEDGPLV